MIDGKRTGCKRTGRKWRCRQGAIRVPHGPRLVVMVKQPLLGRVKTRLARKIGPVAATFFYRHAVRALLLRLQGDRRWQTILSVAPDTATGSNVWPCGLSRVAQGRGDLGARMLRPFERLPPGPLLLIGSDIPQVRPKHIADAFRLLGGHDAVLGPAEDGGFWLVGMKRRPRLLRPFDGVSWSRADTMARTLANLEGHDVCFASVLNDVDAIADFLLLRGWSGRVVQPVALFRSAASTPKPDCDC